MIPSLNRTQNFSNEPSAENKTDSTDVNENEQQFETLVNKLNSAMDNLEECKTKAVQYLNCYNTETDATSKQKYYQGYTKYINTFLQINYLALQLKNIPKQNDVSPMKFLEYKTTIENQKIRYEKLEHDKKLADDSLKDYQNKYYDLKDKLAKLENNNNDNLNDYLQKIENLENRNSSIVGQLLEKQKEEEHYKIVNQENENLKKQIAVCQKMIEKYKAKDRKRNQNLKPCTSKISDKEIQAIIEMYKIKKPNGKRENSTHKISKIFNCSNQTIMNVLKKSVKADFINNFTKEQIIAKYNLSLDEVNNFVAYGTFNEPKTKK